MNLNSSILLLLYTLALNKPQYYDKLLYAAKIMIKAKILHKGYNPVEIIGWMSQGDPYGIDKPANSTFVAFSTISSLFNGTKDFGLVRFRFTGKLKN